ncbi:hypothetical protein DCC81_03710 [Chitinophaga parva]|uniref:HTH araC/xylS-type domain-containing protein n=1 Tax=Chitinophaga parva TaxID=2169414 RepID=A0A2T7BLU0_9BACT|nr:AraC family transcriptional regulator [Chitinophaga parva]PUZ28600.1 hypothetical protein DCC81_03710 [Chitinophaga parva]
MNDIPFEIYLSKNRRIEWIAGIPHNWPKGQMPGAESYYAEIKNKCLIVLKAIATSSGVCWFLYYEAREETTFLLKIKGDQYNMFYLMDGQVEYRSRAQVALATAGQLNIIRTSSVNHEVFLSKDNDMVSANLFIPFKMIKTYQHTFPSLASALLNLRDVKEATVFRWNVEDDGRLKQIAGRWWTEGLTASVRNTEMEKFVFNAFDLLEMSMVAESLSNEHQLESLRKVRARLLASLFHMHPPSLRELSQAVGMHGKMLERLFKASFGMSMLQFFLQARMEAIYRRLCCSLKPLAEIATEFGYEDYSNFSAAVRRRFDQTPSQIRQSAKRKD